MQVFLFKDAHTTICSRVVERERFEYGLGYSKFLPNTALKPKYLKKMTALSLKGLAKTEVEVVYIVPGMQVTTV